MSQVALITKDTEFTWCPACGELYMVDDDEKREIMEHESCYCVCHDCNESFYLEFFD